jgi:tetratricopeptide (TPR) repeat protein
VELQQAEMEQRCATLAEDLRVRTQELAAAQGDVSARDAATTAKDEALARARAESEEYQRALMVQAQEQHAALIAKHDAAMDALRQHEAATCDRFQSELNMQTSLVQELKSQIANSSSSSTDDGAPEVSFLNLVAQMDSIQEKLESRFETVELLAQSRGLSHIGTSDDQLGQSAAHSAGPTKVASHGTKGTNKSNTRNLSSSRLSELYREAIVCGVSPDKVEAAMDGPSPRAALSSLILWTVESASAADVGSQQHQIPKTLPTHGVQLSCLLDLESQARALPYPLINAKRADEARPRVVHSYDDLICSDLIEHIVLPVTRTAGTDGGSCSLAEQLLTQALEINGKPAVAAAQYFVVYSHQYRFADLVAALESQPGLDDAYLWIDMLVCESNMLVDEQWLGALQKTISQIGHTLVLVDDWRQPTPTKRTWCCFEVCATIAVDATLEMLFAPQFAAPFERAMSHALDDLVVAMSTVDLPSTSTSVPEDKGLLLEILSRSPGGIAGLVDQYASAVRRWLLTTAQKRLETTPQGARATSTLIVGIARLCAAQGQAKQAEKLWLEAITGHRNACGDDSPEAIECILALGVLCKQTRQFDRALEYCNEAVTSYRSALGSEHADTLSAILELAAVQMAQDRYDDAQPLLVEVLEGRRRGLGEQHPDTLLAAEHLAKLHRYQGHWREAASLMREVVDGRRRTVGEHAAETLGAMTQLATDYKRQKQYSAAVHIARAALVGYKRTQGGSDATTLGVMVQLAMLQEESGELEESRSLYEEAHARLTSTHGGNTAEAARVAGHLSEVETKIAAANSHATKQAKPHRKRRISNAAASLAALRGGKEK